MNNMAILKITKKQLQEIEFFQEWRSFTATDKEIEHFINTTVHGIDDGSFDYNQMGGGKYSKNPLMMAKTCLDRMLKMWREDLVIGLIGFWEIQEELGDSDYAKKLFKSLMDSLTPQYTTKVFAEKPDITFISVVNLLGKIHNKYPQP